VQNINVFEKYFPMKPTLQQVEALNKLFSFIIDPDLLSCFILKGYAGTGKTTIISTLVKALPALRMNSVLLAPTGRAAKVITSYSGTNAYTIHKKIYRKKVAGTPDLDVVLADNMHKNTLFIIDEASMISNERLSFSKNSLLEDLVEYVLKGENCRLMLVGDIAQLPPVGLVESPALSPNILSSTFDLKVFHYELTDVVRQEKSSGILFNATRIREQIRFDKKEHEQLVYPQMKIKGYRDIFKMTGERLEEGLNYAYQKYGMENTLVICRSNKNANLYNQHIRNRVLYREEELTGGDFIMVVRNNYFWSNHEEKGQGFIANGDMAKVLNVRNVHEQHGFRFADVSLEFIDGMEVEPLICRVLINTLHVDAPNLPFEDQTRLYNAIQEDYIHIGNKKERLDAIKEDPYYNALQIKFAMAVTCHKAQGGQWDAVFVDQGYLTDELLNTEFLRWLYTACTRATKELFLLNFNPKFFEE
jgi:exodeoxyribonuclease-5